jgi:hypothetical protein
MLLNIASPALAMADQSRVTSKRSLTSNSACSDCRRIRSLQPNDTAKILSGLAATGSGKVLHMKCGMQHGNTKQEALEVSRTNPALASSLSLLSSQSRPILVFREGEPHAEGESPMLEASFRKAFARP